MEAEDLLGGRYRLVERLGEGGMSVVWRARDEVLARDVAVKLLSARFAADAAFRERVRAEAQAVAKLSHPNIASVFDYGESTADGADPVPYIVMELLAGSTLAELLESGPLPIPRVLRICAQVATALGAAHEQDVVHRDVKPANVMVTANGTAKVVDFGVAAVIGDLSDRDAVMFGTPAYVAPERLEGGPVVTGTDVYGLGVLLYRMLTGTMPWTADTTTQMLIAHMYVEPDPLPPVAGLPPEVVEICTACLVKEPSDRPDAVDVAAVLTASAAALDGGPAEVTLPDRPVSPAARRPTNAGRWNAVTVGRGRGSRLVAGAAAIVLVAVAAVAAALVQPDAPPAGSTPTAADEATAGQPVDPGTDDAVGLGAGSPSASRAGGRTGDNGPAVDPRPADAPPVVVTPGAGTPVPSSSTPETTTASQTQLGNTVTVACTGTMATITDTVPAEGWVVKGDKYLGPATEVRVRVVNDVEAVQITFKAVCRDGAPRINFRVA